MAVSTSVTTGSLALETLDGIVESLDHAERCRSWNANPLHQMQAGRRRAERFSRAYQMRAAMCSNAAQSARWRARQGIAPLTAEEAQRYVTLEDIRGPLGGPLPYSLRGRIYRAWCMDVLIGVARWLDDPAWADRLDVELDARLAAERRRANG